MIGLAFMAAVAIIIIINFLPEQREHSVEYHIGEYRRWTQERDGQFLRLTTGKPSLRDRLVRHWRTIHKGAQGPVAKRWEHADALLSLGYLEKRRFIITNRQSVVWSNALFYPGMNREFVQIGVSGTNDLIIVAPREDMPKWKDLVRSLDVPESGKPE